METVTEKIRQPNIIADGNIWLMRPKMSLDDVKQFVPDTGLAQKVIKAVRAVCGKGELKLHAPYISGNEYKYVHEVIQSGHISAGEWVNRFEKAVCEYTGAKYAVAVMNATAGLEIALRCRNAGHGMAVGCPSLTFIGTANAIIHAGCVPCFTENISLNEIGYYMPMHFLGHPQPITTKWNYVYDAAQALGSKYGDKFVGCEGTQVFSFNQNKIITTGGGGMIVTDDAKLADTARHWVTTAKMPHQYKTEHDHIAWNYRMSDLTAAFGVGQMEQLPLILKAKRALAQKYIEIFEGMDGVTVLKEPEGCESNYWLNAISLDDEAQLEPVLDELHRNGILARPLWRPLHLMPHYANYRRSDMSASERLWKRVVCLPSSPELGMKYV